MWRSLEGYRSQRKGQVSVSETERTAHTKPKAGKSLMHFRTNKRVNVFESWNKECVTEVGYRQDHSGLEGHSKVWTLLSVTGKHCGFSPSNIVGVGSTALEFPYVRCDDERCLWGSFGLTFSIWSRRDFPCARNETSWWGFGKQLCFLYHVSSPPSALLPVLVPSRSLLKRFDSLGHLFWVWRVIGIRTPSPTCGR